MQSLELKNLRNLLSIAPIHVIVKWKPYPPYWKSNQRITADPQSVGTKIKQRRLQLRWRQADLAQMLKVSSLSIHNWECGVTNPSRRMLWRIGRFLNHEGVRTSKVDSEPFRRNVETVGNDVQLLLFQPS
jgi:DNA-binding XRE family transcriptional regulator